MVASIKYEEFCAPSGHVCLSSPVQPDTFHTGSYGGPPFSSDQIEQESQGHILYHFCLRKVSPSQGIKA